MNRMRKKPVISGILNIDKPEGWTSHDVVAKVRRLSGQKRVGHAGTLDPMATGVLLVCLGQATRVSEYLMRGRKVYRATVHLGLSTDTYDAEGQVTATAPEVNVTLSQLEEALSTFVGRIEQTPPMYSALKYRGIPLYKLAARERPLSGSHVPLRYTTSNYWTGRLRYSPLRLPARLAPTFAPWPTIWGSGWGAEHICPA